jgi:hypothetical protein
MSRADVRSYISGVPRETFVLPVINSNHTVQLAAELENGQQVREQDEITSFMRGDAKCRFQSFSPPPR